MRITIEYTDTHPLLPYPPRKFTAEMPNDVGVDDIIDAMYGLLVGMTYHPDVIVEHVLDWALEHDTSDKTSAPFEGREEITL